MEVRMIKTVGAEKVRYVSLVLALLLLQFGLAKRIEAVQTSGSIPIVPDHQLLHLNDTLNETVLLINTSSETPPDGSASLAATLPSKGVCCNAATFPPNSNCIATSCTTDADCVATPTTPFCVGGVHVGLSCADGACNTALPGILTFQSCTKIDPAICGCALAPNAQDPTHNTVLITPCSPGGLALPAGKGCTTNADCSGGTVCQSNNCAKQLVAITSTVTGLLPGNGQFFTGAAVVDTLLSACSAANPANCTVGGAAGSTLLIAQIPTVTPTPTNTPTSTPTPTATNTNTPTNTPTSTNTPTNTPTVTVTVTNTPTPTRTNTPTNTPTITITPTQPPPVPVIPTPNSPAGLVLIGGLGVSIAWMLRRAMRATMRS